MTKNEVIHLCRQMQAFFDVVRLVDAKQMIQYIIQDDNTLKASPYNCYAVWKKAQRCDNCISALATEECCRKTKFEFVDDEVYHVVATPVEVDGVSYVLEIVTHITDETLFSAYGKIEFIELINNFNKKLYTDALTGVYNRKYYEEHLARLGQNMQGVAMLDMDHFKNINDNFGHVAGDEALRAVGAALQSCVRADDALVRYGGDEFVLSFKTISCQRFSEILHSIQRTVREIVLQDYPDVHLTVSIGGICRNGKIKELVLEADKALYLAKQSKDCLRIKQ